jgi:hypothetical protein
MWLCHGPKTTLMMMAMVVVIVLKILLGRLLGVFLYRKPGEV